VAVCWPPRPRLKIARTSHCSIAGALGAGPLYGVILPYLRMQELEAHRLGVVLMAGASFDPAGALLFWRQMASDGVDVLEWMSTHPGDGRRLTERKALVERQGT